MDATFDIHHIKARKKTIDNVTLFSVLSFALDVFASDLVYCMSLMCDNFLF